MTHGQTGRSKASQQMLVMGSPQNVFEYLFYVGKSWTDKFSSHEPQFLLEVACAKSAGRERGTDVTQGALSMGESRET